MSDKPTCLPDLSGSLVPELAEVIRSYHSFCTKKPPEDAKEFTAYHNACKAALMHITLLMKLIHSTQPTSGPIKSDTDTATHWLTEARQALQNETEVDATDDLFFD